MSNDEVNEIAPAAPKALSAGAERMRAHRARRRKRLRCYTPEIRAREIDVLVQRGLLQPDARNDPIAVQMAIYRHLDETLRDASNASIDRFSLPA